MPANTNTSRAPHRDAQALMTTSNPRGLKWSMEVNNENVARRIALDVRNLATLIATML